MIPEWFEMSLKHFSATIFDGGKLKPEYLFKKIIYLFKIIHSKQIFIFKKSRIFIQNKYSFF